MKNYLVSSLAIAISALLTLTLYGGEQEKKISKSKLPSAIAVEDLPAGIRQYLSREYKSPQIEEAEKVTRDGKTYYEVEIEASLKGSEQELELLFDENGQLLSSKAQNDDDDHDDDDGDDDDHDQHKNHNDHDGNR